MRILTIPALTLASALLGGLGFSTAGDAQVVGSGTTSAGSESAADSLQEVVVTGSRVARTGFSEPTPVTVLSGDELKLAGDSNVAEALNRLPSFRAQTTPETAGFSQSNLGSQILDLRGLGAQRTLVLVDGRRFVASTTQGTFDLSLIPSSLISRTEIVTGGASAAYGSDAVAGVVNVILDTKFNGLKAEAQYGISGDGDNNETQVSLAAGSDIFEGRGHIVFGAEYVNNEGTGGCLSRSWCSPDGSSIYNSTTNPGGPGANGLPATVLGWTHNATMTPAGLITAGPLRGTQFLPNGSVSPTPFTFGANASPFALFMLGGSGANYFNQALQLNPPVKRFTLFQHMNYDFNDNVSGFVEGSFGQVDASANSAPAFAPGSITIQRSNPYLPASLGAQMDALGIPSFSFGRFTTETGIPVTTALRSNYRFAAGLNGKFGDGWSWDGYFQFGDTRNSQSSNENEISANFNNALNSTVSPTGQIVCASTLTAPTNGCSPINPFGVGHISPAALAYAFGTGESVFHYTESVGAANLRGDPFNTWAGPVSTAVGAEYRDDHANGTSDPISAANGFFTNNAAPINGRIQVAEGYLETVVPLLKDVVLAKDLDLNGAVRETHYERENSINPDTTVNATTWKAGLTWQATDLVRARVTRSRDIRAPNISELFSGQAGSLTFINDPVTHQAYNVPTLTGGNAQLQPEKADTWTGGLVLHPSRDWVGGGDLNFSVDYFDIDVKDAVAQLGGQLIVARCVAGSAAYCALQTRDPTSGLLTSISNTNLNLNNLKSRGIDFELDFTTDLDSIVHSLPGRVGIRALATRTFDLTTIDSTGLVTNRAGQDGAPASEMSGVPKWVGDVTFSYQWNRLAAYIQTHTISGGKYDVTLVGPTDPGYSLTAPNSINNNWLPGVTYLNLAASWNVTKAIQVFGSITNLFDSNPPPTSSSVGSYNPVLYDPIGRDFHLGARVRF
jgi:iron complex outermembrane recepter protein